MDGLARMAGGGGSFRLGGKTRRVEPLRLRHWAEIEHLLLYERPSNPLAEVSRVSQVIDDSLLLEHLISQVNSDLRSDKNRRVVRIREIMDWISTPHGIGYTAWCCLRDHNQELQFLEEVQVALANAGRKAVVEFVRLRDQLSGTDLLAAADWPDPEAGVRPEKLKKRRELQAKQFTPWRKFFYVTSHNTGFSPAVIADLTLYQAKVYMCSPEEIGAGSAPDGATGRAGTMMPLTSRRQA